MNKQQHTKEFNELELTPKEKEQFEDNLLTDYREYLSETVLNDENFDLTMVEDFQDWEYTEIDKLKEGRGNKSLSFEDWLRKEWLGKA